MSEQKFHIENWVKHYQSKLSDDSLMSIIEGYGEGAFVRCHGSDDILELNVSLQLYDYFLNNVYVNKETDEEINVEFEVDASIHFNIDVIKCYLITSMLKNAKKHLIMQLITENLRLQLASKLK